MTERKWTPGPWVYRPHKYDDWGLVRGSDDYPVASASICRATEEEKDNCRRDHRDPAEANAHLIAAAPDLYEALEYLLNNADLTRGDKIVAREALAKARGESE